jgi:DNA polymerase-3 subunit alpha
VQARADEPRQPDHAAAGVAAEPGYRGARRRAVVAKLLDIGQRPGLYRHASTHAAGVVIADRPLIELVPLYRDARPLPAAQFSIEMG